MFVRECYICQVGRRAGRPVFAHLKELPRPERAQDIVALDVKGLLPNSHGKKYIIVCVDMFTRYCWARPVNHVDGKAAVAFLVNKVFRFGVPRVLLTDNAPNLKEGLAGHLYKWFGDQHRTSIPYLASSNGGVGRMIGTLASMLRCAILDDPTHWSSWVGDLTFKYNVIVHRATKLTPFEVHFGYRARLLRELEEVDCSQNLPEPERYVADLRGKKKESCQSSLGWSR